MKTALMRTRQIGGVGLKEGCAFASAADAHTKGVLCSKCDDQKFLKFAQHLPSVRVNVRCKSKKELWDQLR